MYEKALETNHTVPYADVLAVSGRRLHSRVPDRIRAGSDAGTRHPGAIAKANTNNRR